MKLSMTTKEKCDLRNELSYTYAIKYAWLPHKAEGGWIWLENYFRVFHSGKWGLQFWYTDYQELPRWCERLKAREATPKELKLIKKLLVKRD